MLPLGSVGGDRNGFPHRRRESIAHSMNSDDARAHADGGVIETDGVGRWGGDLAKAGLDRVL